MAAYIYILSNNRNNVLYVGSTRDLKKRLYFHKRGLLKGFTKKYNVQKLVYYEVFTDIDLALKREKNIKSGSRNKKILLINQENPEWNEIILND